MEVSFGTFNKQTHGFPPDPEEIASLRQRKGHGLLPCPIFLIGCLAKPVLPHRGRHGLFYASFPQELGRFLGRRGIDVESCAPLESRRLG